MVWLDMGMKTQIETQKALKTVHAAFPVPLQFVSCQLRRQSTCCLNVWPCSMLDLTLGSILTAF